MIKKKLSLLLIILFSAVLNSSTENFAPDVAPDVEPPTLPTPQVRSPFIRNSAALPSPFGLKSFGKYPHDLSPYERKELLKIAAFFSTIEAASAGVSCVKTFMGKKDISKINYLLTGLFAFRAIRALSHLYLSYKAVKGFNPLEERENTDTEENKKEAASAQYEVAWKVAGTVADSPLFERIRQESYNFTHQPRGGLEQFKPLLPVAYPLASGLVGAAFDIVKIWQTFRSEPLFGNFKDTENLLLELGSLLAHSYASGNIVGMLPTSIKKYTLAKGLTATYYPSLVIVMALLARNIITTHGAEYAKYCKIQRTLLNIRESLGLQKRDGQASIAEFNTALNASFSPIEDAKKISFANPEKAPKCIHCQAIVSANDTLLVNKNDSRVMHVHGDTNGQLRCCFIKKLTSELDACASRFMNNEDWVLQKPTTSATFTDAHYARLIDLINGAEKFKAEYSKATTKDQMIATITASKKPINYQSLSRQEIAKLSDKISCPICLDSCADCAQNFIVSGKTKQAYHVSCLAECFLGKEIPIEPTTRSDVRTNWEDWDLYSNNTLAQPPSSPQRATRQRSE